jgi:drug/metabolite transporter (DMT)-like permease
VLLPRLSILLAALLWSTSGAGFKLCSLNGWQMSAGRSLVAAATLWLLFPDARVRPTRPHLLTGAAYAATVVLFAVANKLTTAANAIFIQDCAPLYVLLLGPWLVGDRPTRRELLAVPLFLGGMALFFADQLSPGQAQGNLLALASGVAFALCILGLRRLRGNGSNAAMAWGNVMAVTVSAPLAMGGPAPTWVDVGIVLFLGAVLGLAYALFARGLRDVPAVEGSLLVLLEPVLNPVWAFLLAGERPGPWAVAGGAVVLVATAWQTLQGTRSPAPSIGRAHGVADHAQKGVD